MSMQHNFYYLSPLFTSAHRDHNSCSCQHNPYCPPQYLRLLLYYPSPHPPPISSFQCPSTLVLPPFIFILFYSCLGFVFICLHPLLLIAVVEQADLTPPTMLIIPLIPYPPLSSFFFSPSLSVPMWDQAFCQLDWQIVGHVAERERERDDICACVCVRERR